VTDEPRPEFAQEEVDYFLAEWPAPCERCGIKTWLASISFEARLCGPCQTKELEDFVAAMQQPAQDPGQAFIWVESGVSAFSGEPFCMVTLERVDGNVESLGQLTPEEVRAMAMKWIDTANAAEFDASLFAELRDRGVGDQGISDVVQGLRARRKQNES